MKKIKVIKSDYPYEVDHDIQEWLKENQNIDIISVNGAIKEDGDVITYILYSDPNGTISLNS